MAGIMNMLWSVIKAFFKWHFGRPNYANQTMQNIRGHHAEQESRTGFQEREQKTEEARRRKQDLKEGISNLEQEQFMRQREQELRNEQRDEAEMIKGKMKDRCEGITEQETKAATDNILYPAPREFKAAIDKAQYDELNFHLAIAGTSGCGKSSLINAFLNLNKKDDGAALVGVTETTLETGRYPDPGTQPPRPWTVWYDIPGAGTQRISDSQYFRKQSLYIYDSIIVVIGNRFMETNSQIIRSCVQFGIPFFIVRSKSDQEIMNMMKDEEDDYSGPFDSGELYQRCRKRFREESQKMVTDDLERANLPNQVLFCVSKQHLRVVYRDFLVKSCCPDDDCHELALVKELMNAIYRQRGERGDTNAAPETNINTTAAPETNIPEDLTQRHAVWKASVAETIGGGPTENVHHTPQHSTVRIPRALRVLYLPHATTIQALQIELDEQNPGLSSLFVEVPQMLSPKVALLSFGSIAPIPPRITAFKRSQPPKEYTKGSDQYDVRHG